MKIPARNLFWIFQINLNAQDISASIFHNTMDITFNLIEFYPAQEQTSLQISYVVALAAIIFSCLSAWPGATVTEK